MNEFEEAVGRVRRETMASLVQRQPKYRVWGPILHNCGLLFGKDKGRMFEADYLVMRVLDDMADGDRPVPVGHQSAAEYIQRKIDFLHKPHFPGDDIDRLLLYCGHLSEITGISLVREREQIMLSMLFDAQRFGKHQVFEAAVLNEHFYKCDIEGSGKGAMKMFGEDITKYELVEPLGFASRIHDNLGDYERDMRAGYINIPAEDVEKFGMTLEDINDVNSMKVRSWFTQELIRARGLLEEDRRCFPQGGFSLLGRVFVDLYVRRPLVHFLAKHPVPSC